MTIDIQPLPGGRVNNLGDGPQTEAVPQQVARRRTNGQSSDTVNLTDSAERLRQLEHAISRLPVVDARRVEGVQRQLATGNFVVNSDSSAQKMLVLERHLP
jgi:flagellar biosynthesis anti-sigma factor FlgM